MLIGGAGVGTERGSLAWSAVDRAVGYSGWF